MVASRMIPYCGTEELRCRHKQRTAVDGHVGAAGTVVEAVAVVEGSVVRRSTAAAVALAAVGGRAVVDKELQFQAAVEAEAPADRAALGALAVFEFLYVMKNAIPVILIGIVLQIQDRNSRNKDPRTQQLLMHLMSSSVLIVY